MKLLPETQDASNKRKLIKSQVEKRRRQRMNRSLERLRSLLLPPERPQGGPQHRVEKAELLERTLRFLQKNASERGRKAGGPRRSFQEGFSSCLRRASRFLGPKGKGLWLGAALDATFAPRLDLAAAPRSPTHTRSLLQVLRQRSLSARHGAPQQQGPPAAPQQSGLQLRTERPPIKESLSQSAPSQTLWRPWP